MAGDRVAASRCCAGPTSLRGRSTAGLEEKRSSRRHSSLRCSSYPLPRGASPPSSKQRERRRAKSAASKSPTFRLWEPRTRSNEPLLGQPDTPVPEGFDEPRRELEVAGPDEALEVPCVPGQSRADLVLGAAPSATRCASPVRFRTRSVRRHRETGRRWSPVRRQSPTAPGVHRVRPAPGST